MGITKHPYVITKGPGLFDLAHALFRGSHVYFTVRKNFPFAGPQTEVWKVSVELVQALNEDQREDEIFQIHGCLLDSGPDAHHLTNIWTDHQAVTFTCGHYHAKTRTCDDAEAAVEIY